MGYVYNYFHREKKLSTGLETSPVAVIWCLTLTSPSGYGLPIEPLTIYKDFFSTCNPFVTARISHCPEIIP